MASPDEYRAAWKAHVGEMATVQWNLNEAQRDRFIALRAEMCTLIDAAADDLAVRQAAKAEQGVGA